jgi:hypothetical protein
MEDDSPRLVLSLCSRMCEMFTAKTGERCAAVVRAATRAGSMVAWCLLARRIVARSRRMCMSVCGQR